jgi:hypothetical protein
LFTLPLVKECLGVSKFTVVIPNYHIIWISLLRPLPFQWCNYHSSLWRLQKKHFLWNDRTWGGWPQWLSFHSFLLLSMNMTNSQECFKWEKKADGGPFP